MSVRRSAPLEIEIDAPDRGPLERAARAALDAAGVDDGHLAITFVDPARMRELNRVHRGRDSATDVLSFPVDADGPPAGPRELGDVVICRERTADVVEAVVHGVLHLCGHDHERDSGEMLALQERLMSLLRERPDPRPRSGFVALAGRPNVGKSTLTNRIVGEKVAIVSNRPQTTRRAIRGIATGDSWQLVLVDLPGVQRPRDRLTARMQQRMERELADADVALLVLAGDQAVGPGDRFIAEAIRRAGLPAVTVVNKLDLLNRARAVEALDAAAHLDVQGDIYPVSARTGDGLDAVRDALVELLPAGPFLYPAEARTDLPEEVRLAELVREQVLARTREEIPHAVEVEVDDIEERPDDLVVIEAHVWADTEAQKRILVGAGGRMVKAIGTAAREQIEALTGRRVHLALAVRVRRGWRQDDALLDRLGLD